MSYFNVTILGCGSATPTMRHLPSSQVLSFHDRLFMVDCGEGTQLQMRRYGIPYGRLRNIFISHIHGDHFLGLPGLLSTMSLHGIEGEITIHICAQGAELLKTILDTLCRDRSYTLRYNVFDPASTGLLYEDRTFTVGHFPLYHRVPCSGFIFREKQGPRHMRGDMARFYNIPQWQIPAIKEGADFVGPDGTVVPNARLTTDPTPAGSYAYCSDTAYDPRVADSIAGTATVYHEATYGDDAEAKAGARGHSTARQAARTAAAAGASKLIIGHYSKTIADSSLLAAQAAEEFPSGSVVAANEGMKIDII